MSTQIQQHQPRERLSGTFRHGDANARLEALAQNPAYHLVSPATSCDSLPEGCEVAISLVVLDPKVETYSIPGMTGLGISKPALDRIAAAAGIVWIPERSGRLDDGRDPHFCAYRMVGILRAFDGSARPLQGTKQIDLRDGSALVRSILSRAPKERESQAQALARNAAEVDRQRIEIVSMAETKARLRAIRSIGIRTSYTRDELAKPFVVAQTVFTGRTDDPELKPVFAAARARSFLDAHSALYGAAPALPAAALADVPEKRVEAPPPVEATKVDEDDDVPVAAPAPAVEPVRYRLGPLQGKPLGDGDDGALSAYRAQIDGLARDPKWAPRRPKIEAHLAEIDAEMQRRGAEAAFPFDDGLFS
jgi:hypothetical protein